MAIASLREAKMPIRVISVSLIMWVTAKPLPLGNRTIE
jgi:hypothetical protein